MSPALLAFIVGGIAIGLVSCVYAAYACMMGDDGGGNLRDLEMLQDMNRSSAEDAQKMAREAMKWAKKMAESEGGGACDRWQKKMMGVSKITLGFGQILGTFSVTFDVPWPSSLLNFMNVIDITNLDIFQAVNIDCIGTNFTFYDTFTITCIYPMVLLLICWVIKHVRCCCTSDQEKKDKISTQHWKATLFGAFLIYPSVSATVLKIFSFNPYLEDKYLMADYRLPLDSTWEKYAMVGVVATLVYPIGIPLLFLCMLYKYKDIVHDDSKGAARKRALGKVGFICDSYTEEAWYWELVLILQKVLLTGVIIFFKPGTTIQLAVAFVISFSFMIFHDSVKPYIDDSEDSLQRYANIAITLTLFGGILLKTESDEESGPQGKIVMTILLLSINMLVVILFVMQITKKPDENVYRKTAEKKCKKCVTAIRGRGKWQEKPDWEERATRRLLMGIDLKCHDYLFNEELKEGTPDRIIDDDKVLSFMAIVQEVAAVCSSDPEHTLEYVWKLAVECIDPVFISTLLDNCVPSEVIEAVSKIEVPERKPEEDLEEGESQEEVICITEIYRNATGTAGIGITVEPNPINADNESKADKGGDVVVSDNSKEKQGLVSASQKEKGPFSRKQKEKALKIFGRYDFDASGTCNSWEEAQSMTLNIVFTLELQFDPAAVDKMIEPGLKNVDEDPLDFERYWEFFQVTFKDAAGQQEK